MCHLVERVAYISILVLALHAAKLIFPLRYIDILQSPTCISDAISLACMEGPTKRINPSLSKAADGSNHYKPLCRLGGLLHISVNFPKHHFLSARPRFRPRDVVEMAWPAHNYPGSEVLLRFNELPVFAAIPCPEHIQ
jgi:hypothetical protein